MGERGVVCAAHHASLEHHPPVIGCSRTRNGRPARSGAAPRLMASCALERRWCASAPAGSAHPATPTPVTAPPGETPWHVRGPPCLPTPRRGTACASISVGRARKRGGVWLSRLHGPARTRASRGAGRFPWKGRPVPSNRKSCRARRLTAPDTTSLNILSDSDGPRECDWSEAVLLQSVGGVLGRRRWCVVVEADHSSITDRSPRRGIWVRCRGIVDSWDPFTRVGIATVWNL